ncbi:hypothetical protein BN2476_740007 [Paraburkholderia piptadeniae]|uniref:Uncharacterized protein n=1 Tax=Paraburkholderia piptadeniae TaxID=1701573 RepID=A0A1N7SR78_9BURK|nr:hypothetical protein BN2476_740007 [Paraburkholderia piptadeniae]
MRLICARCWMWCCFPSCGTCGLFCDFVCNGFCFGVFAFALASAYAPRGAGVAPVRGGTYSSLPRQRRVGRRKPLTPPVLDVYPRALNFPTLHTAAYSPMCVANALLKRLTCLIPLRRGQRHQISPRPFAANCV